MNKYKILALCDDCRGVSGVGVQARFLFEGLIKTGRYSFSALGGAIKHENYDLAVISENLTILPVDGFGTKEQVRQILITERPDAIFIFTDPRQFTWLWEMEDEINQICPIAYWTIWDNDPTPTFNKVWYDSTDLLNCISWKTYEMLKELCPETTNYIPHAFPKHIYFPIPKDQLQAMKGEHFKEKTDWFKVLWVNRNATRKMPNDILDSWKNFLEDLQATQGHKNAVLIMHTDPGDPEGPNLIAVTELLGIQQNVWFSTQKVDFIYMNILHNLVDCCVNIAKAEGFSLSSLSSLQVGKPVISLKTGGLTRQVIDWRDGSVHGVAIEPAERSLIGSQLVPFLYEDIVDKKALTEAFMTMHNMSQEDREKLGQKCVDYVDFEFNYDQMIQNWDRTLSETINTWRTNKPKQFQLIELGKPQPPPRPTLSKINQPKQRKVKQ